MSDHDKWVDRPDCEAAHSVIWGFCSRPGCGVHIIPLRVNGEAICEVVFSPDMTLRLMKTCSDRLYEKATKRV